METKMARDIVVKKTLMLSLTCGVMLLAGCLNTDPDSLTLERDILNAAGEVLGTVTLTDMGKAGTKVHLNMTNVTDGDGVHALHFHEFGKCDAPDFKSAGGHYNPTNASHGIKTKEGPHAGDMMNIDIKATKGTLTLVNDRVSIEGQHDLPALFDEDGTALIIHEKADDYTSQPTGAAGGRLGCALIAPG